MRFYELQENTDIFNLGTITSMVDLYESRLKDRPTFQDWERNTGLHPAVLTAYCVLGDKQRDEPERIMVAAQQHLGGGVLDVCLEHVGDLSNRMSPLHPYSWAWDATNDKIDKCLRILESRYGFDKERWENWQVASKYSKNPDAWYAKTFQLLNAYDRAHMALPYGVSEAHKLAVFAASSLGDKNYLDKNDLYKTNEKPYWGSVGTSVAAQLRRLQRMINSQEGWTLAMQSYNPALNENIKAWDQITGKSQEPPKKDNIDEVKDVHNPHTQDILNDLLKSFEKV